MAQKTIRKMTRSKAARNTSVKRKKKYRFKYKLRWKVALPLLLLMILALYLCVSVYRMLFSDDKDQITICDYSKSETLEKLNSQYPDVITLSDHLYYGETLDLFVNSYDGTHEDPVIGSKLILKNLCNQQQYEFTAGAGIDQQIKTNQLPEGFYEVYVNQNGSLLRAVYSEVLPENIFYTVAREEQTAQISLLSDPDIMQHRVHRLDKNYLFLKVEAQKPSKDQVDVVIDPFGKDIDAAGNVNEGTVRHNVSENVETFAAAQLLQKELEAYGLRVWITKENHTVESSVFGEESRLKQAYEKQAKYYIKLGLNASPYDYARGMEITHSGHSSNEQAVALMDALLKNTALTASSMKQPDASHPGIIASSLLEGKDGRAVYDERYLLRESGGKATLAGLMDEASSKNSFAIENRHGMQGLEIDFLYLSYMDELNYWKEHRDEIVKKTAEALTDIWGVGRQE